MSQEVRDYFAIILAAALTLVGLIVVFTFSMAVVAMAPVYYLNL